MHDPNGIYDPHIELRSIQLRLLWFAELDHYKVTDEEMRLMIREQALLAELGKE